MKDKINTIGFDADDTLWINQPNYDEIETEYCNIFSEFLSKEKISDKLYNVEMQNLSLYGYGAKSFMLSMIETAISIVGNEESNQLIDDIILLGKKLINKPVQLLDGVNEVLEYFSKTRVNIILITKGDLIDQERKLLKSNLKKYFHHIEIMSDKKESDYQELLSRLNIPPKQFLMIGNSYKSDILPVLNIGGFGAHIPYHVNWIHDDVNKIEKHTNLIELKKLTQIVGLFSK